MSIQKNHLSSAADQAWDAEYGIFLKSNVNGYVDRGLAARLAAIADGHPPSNNMGGNLPEPPPFLPHGEKQGGFVATQKTKIDWLAYTCAQTMEAVQLGISVLWPDVTFANRGRGMVGFPESMEVTVGGIVYGLIGFGAKHERVFVSLTGTGCSTLSDEGIANAYEMLAMLDARLSRLDIALDFYNGERTWDHALWAYQSTEAFKPRRGGHRPECKRVEGETGDGKNLGRTLYIGTRGESEKFVRIYEKGLEVYANMPKELRDASEARAMVFSLDDKQYADHWLRVELEFSRQKRDLPLDMLLKRDDYFAGAYPYCAEAVGLVDGLRPVTLKDETEVDLIKLIGHGKRAYGSLIFTLKELGFTDPEVVQYLSGDKHNRKLVRSGMLNKIKVLQAEILAAHPDHDIPF